jgi:Protein of unknown function (DUF2934)
MSRSDEHLHPEGAPQLPETPVSLSSDADSRVDNMELKAIAQLAYTYWEARGRPWGSPEEDWFRAEHEIRKSLASREGL